MIKMKVFLIKIGIYLLLISTISIALASVSSMIVKSRKFYNYNTESNLLHLEKNKNYDILIMGISHARNFSRHDNHLRMEEILNKKILNIGQGGATCGVNEQLFYLQYCYHKGISADTVLYILSTPLVYADYLNKASSTFGREPFSFDFLYQYIRFKSTNKLQRIQYYIYSKLDPKWIKLQPLPVEKNDQKLFALDSAVVEDGLNLAYLDGLNPDILAKNCKVVEETISFIQSQKSTVILILPPALFGKWMGHDKIIEFCDQMKKDHNVDYFDLSESILQPEYYYDHHHLNSEGVKYFTVNYLKPILH